MSRPAIWVAAALAVGFGLLTIKEGGTVLFGPADARRAAGNYVPFVLWFNFLAGFAYVVAGVALSLRTLVWVMISAVAWRALPRVQTGTSPPP
jgi:hypothetical protein